SNIPCNRAHQTRPVPARPWFLGGTKYLADVRLKTFAARLFARRRGCHLRSRNIISSLQYTVHLNVFNSTSRLARLVAALNCFAFVVVFLTLTKGDDYLDKAPGCQEFYRHDCHAGLL